MNAKIDLESRKVYVRLSEKGNSNSHGARPVHLIITMIQWIRTSRLSIKNSLSDLERREGCSRALEDVRAGERLWYQGGLAFEVHRLLYHSA